MIFHGLPLVPLGSSADSGFFDDSNYSRIGCYRGFGCMQTIPNWGLVTMVIHPFVTKEAPPKDVRIGEDFKTYSHIANIFR